MVMTARRFLPFGGLALGLLCSGCVVAPPALLVSNCREFTQAVMVDGKSQTGYGVECPQPDGSWRVVAPAVVPPPGAPPPATYYAPSPYAAAPYPYYYPYYYPPVITFGLGWGWGWYGHHGGFWRH